VDPVFIFTVGRPLENMHGLIVFYERYVLTALGSGRLPPFYCQLSEEIFYEASFSLITVMPASIFNVVILQ